MSAPKIDAEAFSTRLKILYKNWKKNPEAWSDAASICVAAGPASEDFRYLKSVALHIWLFGYELPGGVLRFPSIDYRHPCMPSPNIMLPALCCGCTT